MFYVKRFKRERIIIITLRNQLSTLISLINSTNIPSFLSFFFQYCIKQSMHFMWNLFFLPLFLPFFHLSLCTSMNFHEFQNLLIFIRAKPVWTLIFDEQTLTNVSFQSAVQTMSSHLRTYILISCTVERNASKKLK